MNIKDFDAEKFAKDYEKELLKARKKAGRTVGAKTVREAKRALGKVSPARKKMIKHKVRKNGTLVHIDSASDARAREYGATVKAMPGKMLRINFEKEDRKTDGDFIANVGGNILLFEGEGDTAKPIAILKKEVTRREVTNPKKLSKIAADNAAAYIREIEKNIEEF